MKIKSLTSEVAREERVVVRFIEFMPLEEDRVWIRKFDVTLDEILSAWQSICRGGDCAERSETARRYRFPDGVVRWNHRAGVASVLRTLQPDSITSDGKLRTCLFSVWYDLHVDATRRGG